MELIFDKVETPEDVSSEVISKLVHTEPGTYRVATGHRKELERLRLAIRDAGYKVVCRQSHVVNGEFFFVIEATVTAPTGEHEPEPAPEPKARVRKPKPKADETPLETGV